MSTKSRASVFTLAAAFPFLVTGCGGEDADLAQASARVAALVPAGAVAFAQVRSLDALENDLRSVVGSFDAGNTADIDVAGLLAGLGPVAGDVAQIDRTRPLGVAFVLDPGGRPGPLLIVPAVDPEAYRDSLSAVSGVSSTTLASGNYVVVSLGGSYTEPDAAPAIAKAMPAGLLTVRANVRDLVAVFRPVIDMALARVERLMDPEVVGETPGVDIAQVVKLYLDGARSVLDSTESVELSASWAGGDLLTDVRLTAIEGSALDGWSTPSRVDLRDLAALLDPEAPLALMGAADFAGLWQRMQPFYTQLAALYDEPLREMMTSWSSVYAEMYAAMGPAVVANVRLGGEGQFRMTMHMRPEDGEAFAEGYARIAADAQFEQVGIAVGEPSVSEVDGIEVRGYPVRFDLAKLGESVGGAVSAGEREEFEDVMRGFFGDGGMSVRLAARDGSAVVVIGGDDAYLRAALAGPRTGAGSLPADLQAAIDRLGDADPCIVYRLDFARLMAGFGKTFAGAAAPFEIPPGASAPMTFYGGVRGSEWRAGMRFDLGGFADLVKSGMPR